MCIRDRFYVSKTCIREKYWSCNNSRTHVQKCNKKHKKMIEKSTQKRTQNLYENDIPKQLPFFFYRKSVPPGDTKLVQNRYQLGAKTLTIFFPFKSLKPVTQESSGILENPRKSSSKVSQGGSCPLKTINSPTQRGTVGRPEH